MRSFGRGLIAGFALVAVPIMGALYWFIGERTPWRRAAREWKEIVVWSGTPE